MKIVTANHSDVWAESRIDNSKRKRSTLWSYWSWLLNVISDKLHNVEEKLPLHPHSVSLFHLTLYQVVDALWCKRQERGNAAEVCQFWSQSLFRFFCGWPDFRDLCKDLCYDGSVTQAKQKLTGFIQLYPLCNSVSSILIVLKIYKCSSRKIFRWLLKGIAVFTGLFQGYVWEGESWQGKSDSSVLSGIVSPNKISPLSNLSISISRSFLALSDVTNQFATLF